MIQHSESMKMLDVPQKSAAELGKLKDSPSLGKLKDSPSLGKLKDSPSLCKLKDSPSEIRKIEYSTKLGRKKIVVRKPILLTAKRKAERALKFQGKVRRIHFKPVKTKRMFTLVRIFDETDLVIQNWRKLMVIPLSYEVWAFPFRLALGSPSLSSGVWYADLAVDAMFWMDSLITLRTSVSAAASEHSEEIKTSKGIALHFFLRKFPYELFPTFIYLILTPICAAYLTDSCRCDGVPFPPEGINPPTKSMIGSVRPEYDISFEKTLISHECFGQWQYCVWWTSTLFRFAPRGLRLSRFIKELEFNLDVSVKTVQFFNISMVIFMTSHWVGCFFFFIARLRYADDTTWLSDMELLLPLYDSYTSPTRAQYVLCLYNGFSSLTSLGYATFVPNNSGEIIFSFVVMVVQVWQTGVIFGTVINYMNERDPVQESHTKVMEDLHKFMETKQLPPDLRERMVRHFEFQHKKATENQSNYIELPKSLEIKVANSKFRNMISGCTARGQLFCGCNPQFLNALLTKLRVVFLMPSEEVFKKGDLSRELCMVFHGACNVMNDDKVKHVVRHDIPEQSSVLGEVPFFFGTIHRFHVRAHTDGDVQLLVLSRADGEELFNHYPEQLEIIRNNILGGLGLDAFGNPDSHVADKEHEADEDVDAVTGDIRDALKSQADETFSALTYAARAGDLEELSSLIRRGAQINQVDYDGRGALAMAAVEGNFKIVEILLQEGADKNVKNRWGQTILQEAMAAKQGPVVELLLQWRVFINAEQAGSSLCTAASKDDVDQLKRLVENKADVNAGDYDFRTALHLAAAEGHSKAVEYLLEQRADPNRKDRWGCTSLMEAIRSGKEGVAILIRSKGGNMPEDIGAVHLCLAASRGDLPSMRVLRGCGITSDTGDYDSRCPLHLAAAEARILAVSFLLGMSSDPNCTDRWGKTPLDDACRGGTLYHKYCGRLILGWGGRFGATETAHDSVVRGEFLREIQQISMDEVRKLISRLIDGGYDKKTPHVISDADIRLNFETTVQHAGQIKALRSVMSTAANTLKSKSAYLSQSMDRITRLLRPICSGVDYHPAKKKRPMSSGWVSTSSNSSSAIPLPLVSQAVLTEELKSYAAHQQGIKCEPSSTQDDDASDGEEDAFALDSDEEAQLHAELDAWVQIQERMEAFGGNQHKYLANVFQKACLQITEIEEMFRNLARVFRVASDSKSDDFPTVTLQEFAIVLDLLRMPTSDCDLEEMFDEGLYLVPVSPFSKTTFATSFGPDTESRFEKAKASFTALVAGSDAFRSKIMSLDTDEVFCDMCKARSLRCVSEAQKRSLARDGQKRNVAKGEIFLANPKPATVDPVKGLVVDRSGCWMVVVSGTFVVEEDPLHLEERLFTEVGPGDIFGGYAVLSGDSTPFLVRSAKGGQILELRREHLAVLCKNNRDIADELASMMGEAPRSALRPINRDLWSSVTAKGVAPSDDSWHRPSKRSGNRILALPETKVHSMKKSFMVIESVWKEISMGETTIKTSQLLAIEKYLGEVGCELFKKLISIHELPETISKTHFWDIWMNFLTGEEFPETIFSRAGSAAGSSESQDSQVNQVLPTENAAPDIIERLHARFSWNRKLRRLFFEDDTIERYEEAFIFVTGDVGTALPAENVTLFLENLFPDFPYRISSYNCEEFLSIFGRDGAKSRQIFFADIRKVLKEYVVHETDVDHLIMVHSSLNPRSQPYQRWLMVVQAVAVYHFIVVPVRIAFLPWPAMTDVRALCSDLPADVFTLAHMIVLANTCYYNGKAQIVTDRLKIVRHLSRSFMMSALPTDWFGYWCGASNEVCCWLRLVKMLFPFHVFRKFEHRSRYSTGQQLAFLFVAVVALLHVTACGWYYLGRQYIVWFPENGITWHATQPNLRNISLIDHEGLFGMDRDSTVWEQYLSSFYWVGVTLTSYGLVGFVTPQNLFEAIYAIALMVLNMTVFRFLIGEVSSIMMMRDEDLVRKRAQLGAVENFLRGSSLEAELQGEIQHHFRTSHVGSSADQAAIFRGLSHSLQVEVSSYTSRGYLDGVPLFAGCSAHLLDAVSVLLVEVNFAPEEYLYRTSEVGRDMFLIIDGSVDDLTETEAGERLDGVHKCGSCTGTLSFFFGMRRLGSARAGRHTGAACLRLSRDEFQSLLKLYPKDEERIAQSAMKSFEGARTAARGAASSRHLSSRTGSVRESLVSTQEQSRNNNSMSDGDENGSDAFGMGGMGIHKKMQILRRRRENKRIYCILQAAKAGDLVRLKALGQGVLDWNMCDHFRRTPLHVAASEGQLAVVGFLLHSKADVTIKDRFDNTPLNDAVRHRHDHVAELIRELAPGTVICLNGHEIGNLMCKSAFDGDLDHVRRIISNGGSPVAVDYDRRSALHLSCCQGHIEIARFLIDTRADVEAKDRFGGTPLDDAVRHGHVSVQALLRANGARLRGGGYADRICTAAASGDIETLRTLVENGVDTAVGDYDGRTALHLAASEGQISVLHFLLDQDPPLDINAMDRTGGTPLDDAIRHGREVVAAMLEDNGAVRRSVLRLSALVGKYSQLKAPERLVVLWRRKWAAKTDLRLREERRSQVAAAVAASAETRALEAIEGKTLPALYAGLETLCQRVASFVQAFDEASPDFLFALGVNPIRQIQRPLSAGQSRSSGKLTVVVTSPLAAVNGKDSPFGGQPSRRRAQEEPSQRATTLPGTPLGLSASPRSPHSPRELQPDSKSVVEARKSSWASKAATGVLDGTFRAEETVAGIGQAVDGLIQELPALLDATAAAREVVRVSLPDLRVVRLASKAYRAEAATLLRQLRRVRELLRFLRRVLKSAKPLFRAGTIRAAAAAAAQAAAAASFRRRKSLSALEQAPPGIELRPDGLWPAP